MANNKQIKKDIKRAAIKTYKKSIGILIDAAQIIAVEASGKQSAPKVDVVARQYLPSGLVEGGMITDKEKFCQFFSTLLRENKFSDAPLVIGAKNQNILLRIAAFPKVEDAKMKNVILYGAQQVLPTAVSELIIDSVLYDEFVEDSRTMVNALIVAAKKVYVDNILSLTNTCGKSVANIDSVILAVHRSFLRIIDPNKAVLIVYIDYETINIIISLGGNIILTRSILISDNIYDKKNDNPNISFEEYWKEIIHNDLLLNQIKSDIKTSINFFHTQRSAEVEEIYICGEYYNINYIAMELSQKISQPVKYINVYGKILDNSEKDYITATSLAISGLGE
ncbi:MAG: pilus assembly protein PilM [Oscillospiraceae bacterium]